MSAAEVGLAVSVFLACAVEAVEALTIVLAVGTTRGWPSALGGVGAATVALAGLCAALGPALTTLPIDALRVVIGGLLLVFGLQWLRKAILRAAGLKALHDEQQAFIAETRAARAVAAPRARFDPYSFTVAFKGVLLEGLEVAFIVVTFGANQRDVGLAVIAAGLAIVLVVAAGLALRAPLARVPENAMKLAVGVMLTSFGMFWGAEGAGASWPGGDAALPALVVALLAFSMLAVARLREHGAAGVPPAGRGARRCRRDGHPRDRGVRVGLRGGRRLGERGRSGARDCAHGTRGAGQRRSLVDPAAGRRRAAVAVSVARGSRRSS